MAASVALVQIQDNYQKALNRALSLIGGIDEINTPERIVTIKPGIFDHRSRHHTCIEMLEAIIKVFDRAQQILITESDSYCGEAKERLTTCYEGLFNDRVVPWSLSGAGDMRDVYIAGEKMSLSQVLFKPNVLVDTHVLRTFSRGSILKNLFGCTPMVKKSKYHKTEVFNSLLADIYEAAGGIDLAVMDGTYLFSNAADIKIPVGIILAGKDAVAVECVGAMLAGLKPEKSGTIEEFVRRGLGEGDLKNIEILGTTAQELAVYVKARKALKKIVDARPRLPGISDTIDTLTDEGWFNNPRTTEDVMTALKTRGVVNVKKEVVETTLKRRAGKTLERFKTRVVTSDEKILGYKETWFYQKAQG